ncbi:Sorbose reductase sou1 [Cryptotrichosporon argae]
MVWQIDLSGKTVIVTGGDRGIGLSICHQVAQAGAHVAMFHASPNGAPDAQKAAGEVADKHGVRCKAYQVDVQDDAKLEELYDGIYRELGPLGGVVCNAGVAVAKPALELTRDDYDTQFGVNVWGAFTCAQAAAKLWKKHDYKNGRVVFVCSISGSQANRGAAQAFYNSSKGAVKILAKTLAMEWAEQGILVNCLSPGYVDTDMNQSLREDAELRKKTEEQVMLQRLSTTDEQAGTVVFFLSDYASYVTGTELKVDGGLTSW